MDDPPVNELLSLCRPEAAGEQRGDTARQQRREQDSAEGTQDAFQYVAPFQC